MLIISLFSVVIPLQTCILLRPLVACFMLVPVLSLSRSLINCEHPWAHKYLMTRPSPNEMLNTLGPTWASNKAHNLNNFYIYHHFFLLKFSSLHIDFLLHPFRKPKRVRTAFSPTQLLKLEHAFENNQYVVGAERKQLAQQLSLTETQVSLIRAHTMWWWINLAILRDVVH